MSRFLGQMFGALLITYLLSRFGFWLLRKWDGGINKIGVVHTATLAFCWVLYAFGSADGGPPNWSGGLFYAIPQLVWFVFDVARGTGDINLKADDLSPSSEEGQASETSFSRTDGSEKSSTSKVIQTIGGLLAFVAAFLAVKYIVSGTFFGSRQAWTAERVDAELLGDPDARQLYSAIKSNYPDEYQRFTQRLADTARANDNAASEREAFAFTRRLMVDHFDDLARAPSAEIQAIARQYVLLYHALRSTDTRLCAQLTMTGFQPGARPPPEVNSILGNIGAMQIATARSGETQPRDPRGAASDRDAALFNQAVLRLSPRASTLLADPRALNAASPEEQCGAGVATYEAAASLPTDESANVTIELLRSSFGLTAPAR